MSLLERVKAGSGGITSRSVRDAGIVGFKLDKELVEGLVVEELFDCGAWQQYQPNPFPTETFTELITGAGVMMGFKNHKFATQNIPIGSAFAQGFALSPWGFPVPTDGQAGSGVQHLWTESMGGSNAQDVVHWYPGRFACKVGKPLNRGFLTKMKIGMAQFDEALGDPIPAIVFGVRAFPANLDPNQFWADAYLTYENLGAVELTPDGVSAYNATTYGRTPTLNGGEPLYGPSEPGLGILGATELTKCIELSCILKDGRLGFWVNGVDLGSPANFAFPDDMILLPFLWWQSASGLGILDYKSFSYYRLHHVDTEIQEAEANILCNDGQVEAGPVEYLGQLP